MTDYICFEVSNFVATVISCAAGLYILKRYIKLDRTVAELLIKDKLQDDLLNRLERKISEKFSYDDMVNVIFHKNNKTPPIPWHACNPSTELRKEVKNQEKRIDLLFDIMRRDGK